MLVMDNNRNSNNNGTFRGNYKSPSSVSPSILDSPTLARVERARRRNENEDQQNSPFHSTLSSYCPSLISFEPGREMHAIKKGLLWQQRERLFSRWKERYFILTRDYLHCFKRSSGSEKISNMGQFIFKIKLVEVEKVEWINKKSYSTVALVLQDRECRILLRTNDGLEDWFELLEECTMTSKERRKALHKFGNSSCAVWSMSKDSPSSKIVNNNNNNIDSWLLSRNSPASIALEQSNLSDSVPDLQQKTVQQFRDEQIWGNKLPMRYQQRLSLLTDIDLNNCDNSMSIESSSIQSTMCNGGHHTYQMNNNHQFFLMSSEEKQTSSICSNRSVLSPLSSFRNYSLFTPSKSNNGQESRLLNSITPVSVKCRDRSQSDAFNCKVRHSSGSSAVNRRSYISQQATHV